MLAASFVAGLRVIHTHLGAAFTRAVLRRQSQVLSLLQASQGAQYPLLQEYTLNHIRDPSTVFAIFLDYGVLGSPGSKLGLQAHAEARTMSLDKRLARDHPQRNSV